MFRSLIAAVAAKLRGFLQPGWSARARMLEQERKRDFFSWFHLDPVGDPAPASFGRTWHCFRPDGDAFRAFVELDVLIDRSGRILESRLGLDRAFADHPRNGVFARDLAKSYLQWGLTGPLGAQARTLIDNIANPAAAGVRVLIRASAMPPTPDEDTTGGYLVYLGRRTTAEAIFGNSKLTITNLPGSFPERQIFAAAVSVSDAPQPDAHSSAQRPSWLRLNISPAITLH
jgi:hypothetical protein